MLGRETGQDSALGPALGTQAAGGTDRWDTRIHISIRGAGKTVSLVGGVGVCNHRHCQQEGQGGRDPRGRPNGGTSALAPWPLVLPRAGLCA